MDTASKEHGGNIWSDNHQLRAAEAHDLVIGIAAYTRRRKHATVVDENTTVPEIPQDAA